MVGEGVLLECLKDPRVEAILVISRKSIATSHPGLMSNPRLKEIVHPDFYDFSAIEKELTGYNACFFCLGVSSVGMAAEEYYKITYTLTLTMATVLSRLNPGMTFSCVSGAGTDRTENGRSRWARVKGKTENDLRKLPFRHAYAFRPGFIKPIPGQQHVHSFYRYINWMYPLGRALYPNGFNTLHEIALAMMQLVGRDYKTDIITGKDISALAKE